ncbi:MAG: selenocysteine-specific translation elongation factor [Fusobacteriaceae bacterium]
MRNLIIGTAGHIDHGKTTLIKNLTGFDTDTLPEESKRGMTINLGFAYYTLPSKKKVGIIDVPGHEKFIKNMVAGASGIDFIMLVIACDDGIMPQTIEHSNICKILGVQKGLIVLTKRDLASDEKVLQIKKEIKEIFQDSFLKNLPIVEVSSKSLKSYENLKTILNQELEKINLENKNENDFRMAVDRVFTVKGFGTVVTGTTISGIINEGDIITLYPNKTTHKVKGIQNHGIKIISLDVGNRCALNLSNLDVQEVKRGDIISKNKNLDISNRIDCIFTLLNKKNKVKNNSRIRLHIGTTEVIGRIKLLMEDEIVTSKPTYVQLELENNIVAVCGSIGVIRNYSPLDTIGGIKILNPRGSKTKKRNLEYINRLKTLAYGNKDSKIISLLNSKNFLFLTLQEIIKEIGENIKEDEIQNLVINKELIAIESSDLIKYLSATEFKRISELVKKLLEEFHEKNKMKKGIQRSELKNKLFNSLSTKEFNSIISNLQNELLDIENENIFIKNYKIKLSKDEKKLKDEILTLYKKYEFSPENIDKILEKIEKNKKIEFIKLHEFLIDSGFLISLDQNIFIMRGFFIESENRLKDFLFLNQKITLKEYKELLNISRKEALVILEKFDALGITKRIENYRVLKKF